jgi:hypothetical protein
VAVEPLQDGGEDVDDDDVLLKEPSDLGRSFLFDCLWIRPESSFCGLTTEEAAARNE